MQPLPFEIRIADTQLEDLHRRLRDADPAVRVPSGFAVFPEDVLLVPRKLAERHANVQHWTVMPRGGHFAPAEEPDLLVEDVRAFFRTLR